MKIIDAEYDIVIVLNVNLRYLEVFHWTFFGQRLMIGCHRCTRILSQ